MKKFRKVIFWTHLICGAAAGIFIFTMCVSGALLSFESNILEFTESDMRQVAAPSENAQRLPVTEILAKAREAKPAAQPSAVFLQNDKNSAATISLGRAGQIFVNPYTGAVTGEGAKNWREFFRAVEDAHRWLALSGDARQVGKAINDACNLMFLLLAITGIYIWFPRRLTWKHFKAALTFRWKVKGKARDFNWHTVIGFWSSLVLIILTATAVVMSYNWANNLLYTLTGSEPPRRQGAASVPNRPEEQTFLIPENLDEIWTKAESHAAWKSISLRLPITDDSAVFTIDEGKYLNKFARSTLTIDVKSGEAAKWETYGDQTAGRRLRTWIRFTHTGETGGLIGQLIGFLACVGGAFLVWTGLSLALRRFRAWRVKKAV